MQIARTMSVKTEDRARKSIEEHRAILDAIKEKNEDKAEELAGERLEAVQRSRLQWRYVQHWLHPNAATGKQLAKEINGYGIYWCESNKPVNEETADFSLTPDKWY